MSPSQSDGTDHRLDAKESDRIFLDNIAPRLFANGKPRRNPTVYFVCGQPGAGKSAAERRMIDEVEDGMIVTVDADVYRIFHPDYERLASTEDLTAADHTHADAAAWVKMAVKHAISHRFDVVVSATLGDSQSAATTINQFRIAGYRVKIAFVAVDNARSSLGVLSRYHEQRRREGYGRYVPPHVQRRAYTGLLHTADMIDQERLADSVRVYSRDGRSLYSNSLKDGEWQHPANARSAIVSERTRPWTRSEITQFLTTATELSKPAPHGLRAELRSELSTVIDKSKHNIAGPRSRREAPTRFHTTRVSPTAIR